MIPKGTVGQFGPVYGASGNHGTCAASGFLTQFIVSSPLYNATLAFYYLLMVRYNWKERDLVKIEPIIHGIPLCFGLGTAIAAAVLDVYGSVDWLCWINPDPPQPNTKIYQWTFLFGPVFLCVIFITTVMVLLYRAMRKQERVVEKYAFESSMTINSSFATVTAAAAAASNSGRSTFSRTKSKMKKKTKCSTEIAIQGMLYVGGFYIC
jgi:magnesium-transporting ATPase (P-type)